jgi:ABC-type transport system involved in multi-copper enzyme maturation permease subunit
VRRLSTLTVTAALAVQEALRRRAIGAILAVSAVLLGLFTLAAAQALPGEDSFEDATIGATLLGTAAFSDLLLGAVVAVALSHSAIRGDAERGLLQPVFVRPVSRGAVVLGRALAGAGIAVAYALGMWLAAVGLLALAGGWTPVRWLEPGLAVAAGAGVVACLAIAASAVLPAQAAGSVTLVLVGLGFTVGLLAQLGDTLGLATLVDVAGAVSYVLPFEALYRHALGVLGDELGGLDPGSTVGPFGGARTASALLVPWTAAWLAAALGFAVWRARRMDV